MANSPSSTLESTPDETGPSVGLGKKIDVLPASFYASFLSQAAKRHTQRHTPAVRGFFPLEQTPRVISLLAGKPNAALFPLTGVRFTALRVDGSGAEDYAPTNGIPPMIEWLTVFQEPEHGRRRVEERWRVSVTAGSHWQDAIHKASMFSECAIPAALCRFLSDSDRHVQAVHALVNPGDPVLIEKPVYADVRVIPMFEMLLCKMTEVETDANGLISRPLQNILNSYYVEHFDSFSKIILASASVRDGAHAAARRDGQTRGHSEPAGVLLRPGRRPSPSRDRDGFLAHVRKVADFYRAKRDMFEAAMRLHLHGPAEWNAPEAGMFFWYSF
ncbi:hypothetical protein EDB89DRAFT_2067819 [Lactarius sanguifluus]|nr:hypothetical protein EDB89DRAFT_2067819 [Lactarius sanguifluus]